MRRNLFAFIAMVMILGSLLVTSKPTHSTGPYWIYNSAGCSAAYGYSFWSGLYSVTSETGASTCTKVYRMGNYLEAFSGPWHYNLGPGWVSGTYTGNEYYPVDAANNVGHSGCSQVDCSGASYTWTSA